MRLPLFLTRFHPHVTVLSAPNAPTDVRDAAVEDTRVQVRWSAPSPARGRITAYQLIYRATRDSETRETTLSTDGTQTSKWINNLQPHTTYEIQVPTRYSKALVFKKSALSTETTLVVVAYDSIQSQKKIFAQKEFKKNEGSRQEPAARNAVLCF